MWNNLRIEQIILRAYCDTLLDRLICADGTLSLSSHWKTNNTPQTPFAARNFKDDNFLFSRNVPEQVKVFTGEIIQVVNQPGIA